MQKGGGNLLQAVFQPLGEARPVWKVLRVLGNLFNLEGLIMIF